MGACIGKRWLVGLCRGSEDSVQEENTSAVYAYINEVHDDYARVNGGRRPEYEYQTRKRKKQLYFLTPNFSGCLGFLKSGSKPLYCRSAQPFWAKGRSVLFLVHSRDEDQIIS